ncbi:putative Phosphate acetyltransferase [uncultured delta proteobacterium]|uniref:Phosphate acetyltransferase n=1 Tax=uncultured delta proteobacterium TaxID=34034 RepID=A0A212KC82_9DELT|nr:putative Phosphate acetyltransferase [uncultured delta proteobacterium]
MANKLFLLGTGPQCGKTIAAFGIIDYLQRQGHKVAFYRPIISYTPHGSDEILTRLIGRYKPSFTYEDAYAYTLAEVRELINDGKESHVYDTILGKCKRLEETHDFVVCIGSDFFNRDMMLEFEVNTQIAADLGAPALVVVKGSVRNGEDLSASARGTIRDLRAAAVEVIGCALSWSRLSADAAKKFKEELRNAPEEQRTPNVFVLPENADASSNADASIAYLNANMDVAAFVKAVQEHTMTVVTPKMFEFALMERAKKHKMRIVLPEGEDDRILLAAADVAARKVADIIILGDEGAVKKRLGELNLTFDGTIINPRTYAKFDEYAAAYFEARKSKGITMEQAKETMLDASYFGTMMVWKDDADGMVSGARNTTAHTITPAFQFVKMKPGITTVSSIFLMCMKDRVLAMGDCAVNPNPTPEQLAAIAVSSAQTARIFGVEPRVAMLSYSTGTSGKGPDVDAVAEATKLAQAMAPDLPIDGPLQYDAAIDPVVAKTKLPNSKVAGKATVFIFPDLNTGNNTYKAVQRAANAVAVGPILQGLNKPVNDLSRGCLVPDVINTIAITAVQAQAEKGLI